ncbi:MAG TPA: M17 family peptidase N-terminal domain-containing protein [Polyangiaceae bacterium]|nr:M17 family peptidase N-terminal domain-containing protein [Polyangiaceae bacterium]
MELRFLNPDLRPLDGHPTEVLVGNLFAGERPPRGVAGLVNWRLGGRVDGLIESGFLTGDRGEVLLLPGRPRLEADKVLLFGLGGREGFDDAAFDLVADKLLDTLLGLCVRSAVVELPGRHDEALAPERAADRFLAAAAARGGAFDAFVLVDGVEAQKRIQHHMVEERRRVRRG